jgi:hypothetical protein
MRETQILLSNSVRSSSDGRGIAPAPQISQRLTRDPAHTVNRYLTSRQLIAPESLHVEDAVLMRFSVVL